MTPAKWRDGASISKRVSRVRPGGAEAGSHHRPPPKLAAGNISSSNKRLQFCPLDRRVCSAGKRSLGETAIRRRDNPLAAHKFGKPRYPLSDEIRVLDDICTVADKARQKHFVSRKLDRLPDAPFVFMARIGHFQRIGARIHLQNQAHDVLGRNIVGVRPVPASPANMIANALRR
jgi:hypothetical protein